MYFLLSFFLDTDLLNLFSCLDLNRNDDSSINKNNDNDIAIDKNSLPISYNYYDKKTVINNLTPNLYG